MWFIGQMRRWNQLPPDVDARTIADASYRPDLYRAAAAKLGAAYPSVDLKSEGHHSKPRMLPPEHVIELGSDRFFDGATYDPR
jgi:hypothetical protein